MTVDSAGEIGAAAAAAPASAGAEVPPVPIPEPFAPDAGPAAIAAARKADVLSVGASVAGHLFIGLLIFGALATAQKPPQAISVKLIPADQAPKPQHKPPFRVPPSPQPAPAASAEQRKQTPAPPPKPAASDPAKGASGGEKAPAPAKANTADEKKNIPWSRVLSSLGLADSGRKTTVPPELLARLRAQAKRCWNLPSGWSDPAQVTVTLRFQLAPDGALDGDPAVVEFPATPAGAAAAKTAIEAVTKCGPYRLPAAQYEQWKDIQLVLAP